MELKQQLGRWAYESTKKANPDLVSKIEQTELPIFDRAHYPEILQFAEDQLEIQALPKSSRSRTVFYILFAVFVVGLFFYVSGPTGLVETLLIGGLFLVLLKGMTAAFGAPLSPVYIKMESSAITIKSASDIAKKSSGTIFAITDKSTIRYEHHYKAGPYLVITFDPKTGQVATFQKDFVQIQLSGFSASTKFALRVWIGRRAKSRLMNQ